MWDYDAHYTYDAAGNVLSVADAPEGETADVQCFDYDGLRRLTQAWSQDSATCAATPSTSVVGGAAGYWTSYTFDQVGNRTAVVEHATAAGGTDTTLAYTYPAAGSAQAHAVSSVTASGTASGTSSYSYDATGNTTTRQVAGKTAQTLTWDAEGELSKVAEGDTTKGQFVYTADGDRLTRTQDGTTTVLLPGGMELSLSGTTVTAQRYFAFNGQSVAVRTDAGASGQTTIVADHHGTGVLQVAQANNSVSRRYTDPYGQARGAAAAWTGDRTFLDKTADATGLVAVGARYYDPIIGRFISVDPVMDLADPQQWNAYAYSNNNPLTWSDPSGMIPIGAGHVGYNPKQKNDKRKYDTCSKATSCVKTAKKAGGTVRVRESYTRHAYRHFNKYKDKSVVAHTKNIRSRAHATAMATTTAASVAMSGPQETAAALERVKRWNRVEVRPYWLQTRMRSAWGRQTQSFKTSRTTQTVNSLAQSPALKWGGRALGVAGVGIGVWAYHESGDGWGEAATKTAVDTAAIMGLAKGGAVVGAAIGSLFPGVGTAIGAGVGGVIGAGIGFFTASAINQRIEEKW
ncbi:RHS repeat-associated core domain-containing protein [Isoptericola sp. NEAU-Y5]|uniref:RHS repeat-associated core domain-containing protein n=1 Tax=Isoptericola luteus TaxID=2879484 RepID=A0ABS7ZBV7_9MICO|nr:RHS repeat-associated core domain-containing protein [Isoptericola sp. NEAU-Y5]MCA5892538.1 RHS repeat-associated core domain-containing protein [Isoptericola sp. NEAU-Y5]